MSAEPLLGRLELRDQHEDAPQAVDDRRHRGEQLDQDGQRAASRARAQLGDVERGRDRDRHADGERDRRGDQRADDAAAAPRNGPCDGTHWSPKTKSMIADLVEDAARDSPYRRTKKNAIRTRIADRECRSAPSAGAGPGAGRPTAARGSSGRRWVCGSGCHQRQLDAIGEPLQVRPSTFVWAAWCGSPPAAARTAAPCATPWPSLERVVEEAP